MTASFAPSRTNLATWVLVAALCSAFALELAFQVGPTKLIGSINIKTLIATGAVSLKFVVGGEPWRLLTAPVLHGSFFHLAANLLALWYVGSHLERVIGHGWLLASFFLGELGGVAGSLFFNSDAMVTVGASGAIMALVAEAFVLSTLITDNTERSRLMGRMAGLALPALVPSSHSGASAGFRVDYAAHIGGAAVGLVLGLLLWSRLKKGPFSLGQRIPGAIAACAVIGTLFAGGLSAWHYPLHVLSLEMIPPDIWPKSEAEGQQRANELAQSYPLDPRAHLFLAEFLLKKGDRDGAIHEAEVARSSDALKVFKPDVRARMVEIATSLIEEGRKAPAPAAPAQPETELGKSTPTDTREAASLQSSSNPSASSPPSQDAGVPQHAPAFVSQPIPHFAPPQQAPLEPTKEASNRSEDGPNDATSQELSEDARAWNEVRTSRSISRLNKFARAYPQSPYAPIARQLSNLLLQDEQLKAWRRGLEQRANGAPPSRP